MPAWVVWVIAAAALAVAEVFSLTLVLGLVAVAALFAAVAALLGADVAVQVLVFAAGSLLMLVGVRPIARKHLRTPGHLRTGVEALVGSTGVVTERIDGSTGQVRLGGEVWSARAYDGSSVIEPGRRVDVLQISGATALVTDSEGSWELG